MPTQEPEKSFKNDYKPVSCDLSDELEALSTLKKPVRLKIENELGRIEWRLGHIQDLYARNHADYLKLRDGTEIRLDKILEWREASI